MNKLLSEDFSKRLNMAPKPNESISQLFDRAKEVSEQRFYLTIIDLYRTYHQDKAFIHTDNRPMWVMEQFGQFLNDIIVVEPSDFKIEKDSNFIRRIHMLAYAQFWECLAIQRLLTSLVKVVNGDKYEPRLFVDKKPPTYNIYKDIIEISELKGLTFSSLLKAVYSNQVRNAFAHSQFYILAEYICLENHDDKYNIIPSLKIETWDRLFRTTTGLIFSIFENRRKNEQELINNIPYNIYLSEFEKPFSINKDDRGYWAMGSISKKY